MPHKTYTVRNQSHWPTFLPLTVRLHSNFCGGFRQMHLFCSRVHIGRSRSSKVVDFGANRKGVCNFLLVINSNLVTLVLSCAVSHIRRLTGWKLRIFPTPLSFNALARGEPFRISGWFFYPENEIRLVIRRWRFRDPSLCFFFSQCQRVTERQTNRQTDGETYPTMVGIGLAILLMLTPCKK